MTKMNEMTTTIRLDAKSRQALEFLADHWSTSMSASIRRALIEAAIAAQKDAEQWSQLSQQSEA